MVGIVGATLRVPRSESRPIRFTMTARGLFTKMSCRTVALAAAWLGHLQPRSFLFPRLYQSISGQPRSGHPRPRTRHSALPLYHRHNLHLRPVTCYFGLSRTTLTILSIFHSILLARISPDFFCHSFLNENCGLQAQYTLLRLFKQQTRAFSADAANHGTFLYT